MFATNGRQHADPPFDEQFPPMQAGVSPAVGAINEYNRRPKA
jgi:hypothetical protein